MVQVTLWHVLFPTSITTNNATHEPEKNSQSLNEIEEHFSAGRSFQSYTEFQSYAEFTWCGWSTPEIDKHIQNDLGAHRAHQGALRNKLLNALNPKGILLKNEPSPNRN